MLTVILFIFCTLYVGRSAPAPLQSNAILGGQILATDLYGYQLFGGKYVATTL